MAAALLALALLIQNPQPLTLRGTVVNGTTNSPIADAQVTLVELARSTRTGADGKFEFTDVPIGGHTLTVSTIGYIFVRRRVDVSAKTPLDLTIPLAEGTGTYQETVTVAAERSTPPNLGVSSQIELGSAALSDLRGVATDDPMRAMQALPGVATGDDFQAEFSVRGSAFRHVGVVIDGTATPLLMHAVRGADDTGSVAMINTDTLSRGTLLQGAHPQREGDWLGATLEFDVRDGTRDRINVRAAVSGTSASTVVEGPIGKTRRGSWLVSARKSYLDWLIRKLEPNTDSTIGFYDGSGKLVYDVTPRQQVQFFMLGGVANYQELQTSIANGLEHAKSKTGLMSQAWRYTGQGWVLSERVSFVGSDFRNNGMLGQELARGYTQALIARVDFMTSVRGWAVEAGARRERYRMNQILRDYVAFSANTQVRVRSAREVTDMTTLLDGWGQISRRTATSGASAGLRIASRTLATGTGVSPWVLLERQAAGTTFRVSAGGSAQFFDPSFVLTANEIIRPEHAFSVDLGAVRPIATGVTLQVTAFHRSERDMLRPVGEDRLDPVRNVRIPESIFPIYSSAVDGTSRGVDVVLMRRATSGLTGWIGYTWAHTRQRDTLTGETFDADMDQRHTLNIFALQRLSYRMTIGAKLRIGSNTPLVGYFTERDGTVYLGTERNDVRLPRYTRLDVRVNRTFTFDRRRMTLFVELMNATGHDNIGQHHGSIRPNFEVVGYAEKLIPFVPSAGILFEF
jgi:hypothetical protein